MAFAACITVPLTIVAIAGHASAQSSGAAHSPESTPAAIIAAVRGRSTIAEPSGAPAIRLFDRLPAGAVVEAGPGAELVVIHRTGARVRVLAAGRIRIDAGGLATLGGRVEAMPPVPTVPLVAPVAGAGTTIAAVRIRAGGIAGLQPDRGAAALADATVLEFAPANAARYHVQVEAPDATLVYQTSTTDTRVGVPDGRLAPGVEYRWRVAAKLPAGFDVQGDGRFRTLSRDETRARSSIRDALSGSDAESGAFLAEIDWTLGLWREALAGFRAARQAGAGDPVIAARIGEIERRLGAVPHP